MNSFQAKYLYIIIFLLFSSVSFASSETGFKIYYKINNEIITNFDLENEKKFLLFLNPNLENLSSSQIENLSDESIKNRKIKEIELKKYFDFENNNAGESYVNNFISNSNINNKDELLNKLKSQSLSYTDFKHKFLVDNLWREFVFNKFKSQVNIDISILKNQVQQKQTEVEELNLSEILFDIQTNSSLEKTKKIIFSEIENSGFEAAASIFSISESKKFGGKLGWIKSNQIAKKIFNEINKGKVITNPIKTNNGYLILKINERRKVTEKIDIDEELNKLITRETEKEINKLGYIYFNKIKKRMFISEN